ncbi:unnamed protein product [Trichobilharzia regenti]|nr:unnamed protein product [Trichobilharzia regenti]
MLFAVASSYDPQYVRCHLSADWLAPFVIMSHIFSKFSSPRALVTSYFLGLALCLLLNQSGFYWIRLIDWFVDRLMIIPVIGQVAGFLTVYARVAYVNLSHPWRRRDVSLAVKGRVYNASVGAVLLYACETWSLRAKNVRRFCVFQRRMSSLASSPE